MQASNFIKAALLALVVSFITIVSWEFYLRYKKMPLFYDDNEALWADKRAMVYEPRDQSTVFIGSSRIKFDLDIPTWQTLTGERAIQLANLGSSPRAVLEDLANDKNFSGKLIIDVTEGLFFADFSPRDAETYKKIAYYKNRTPTQRFSFQVDRVLESQLLFLDQDNFSLNAMLDQLKIPPRPGVFQMPLFPIEFEGNNIARQSYMTPQFVADTNLQNQVKAIWRFFASIKTDPSPSGDKLQAILNSVKLNVDKIKSRGGQVLFVRTPSTGPFRQGELKGFPRSAYWDRLLATTECPGIYFEDYPAIAHFICPEWSHLTPRDAVIYTKNIIKILQEEKGWSFSKKPGSL